MWDYIYQSTKMPLVPMYGVFPVKLKTHIGSPIYPKPGMTPEELRQQTVDAMEAMIAQHQTLPGNLGQVCLLCSVHILMILVSGFSWQGV